MKYILNFLKKQPLICAILAFVFCMGSLMSLYTGTPTGDLLLRLLFSGTCGVFLYLISGEKAVRDYSGSTAYVIKTLSVYWIISGLLGCLSVLPAFFIDDTEFYSDWYFRLITNIFFLFVSWFV